MNEIVSGPRGSSDSDEREETRFSSHIINRGRVEVRDSVTDSVVGEAVRYGNEDWFVSIKIHDGTSKLIGKVHSNHVNEVQGRRMILWMLKAYFGIST